MSGLSSHQRDFLVCYFFPWVFHIVLDAFYTEVISFLAIVLPLEPAHAICNTSKAFLFLNSLYCPQGLQWRFRTPDNIVIVRLKQNSLDATS